MRSLALRPEDKLEEMLFRFQLGFNFDADLNAKDSELIHPLTIEECMMLNQIEEWREDLG